MIAKKLLSAMILLMVIAPAICCSETGGEPPCAYGVRFGAGAEQDAQFISAINSVFGAFARAQGTQINYMLFDSDEEYLKAVINKELTLTSVTNRDLFVTIIDKYKFKPLIGYSVFEMEKNRMCLFVHKDDAATAAKELKGAGAVTIRDAHAYFLLRKIVAEKPEAFFSRLEVRDNGVAALFSLAEGAADTAFATMQLYEFLKVVNPAPVNNLRALVCSEPYEFLPFLSVSPRAPDTLLADLKDFFGNPPPDDEEFKRYLPTFRTMKLKIKNVKVEDFVIDIKLFRESKESGWYNDYNKWIEGQEKISDK